MHVIAVIRWSQLPSLVVFGLVLGAVYALASVGLVVIYRGTRVFNLAHGAMAMFGAYLFSGMVNSHVPKPLALLLAAAACGAVGAGVERVVMRRLDDAGTGTKVVATLGLFITLQAIVILVFGAAPRFAPTIAPDHNFRLPGSFSVSAAQLVILGVSLVLFGVLFHLYQRTDIGLLMQAVAAGREAAALQGVDVGHVSMLSWVLGSVCAGVAGILLAPLLILDTAGLPLIVIESFAAALIGGLTSFPFTLAGALSLGLLQSTSAAFVQNQGTKPLLAFVLILLALSVRRDSVDSAVSI